MSAPHRSSRRSTDHASTATERAANAARAMAVRAARRRDRMVEMGIALLDEFLPSGQRPQTRAEVGEFYTVADTVVAQVLRCHAAEFRRDGWRAGDGADPEHWTEAAVVRVGLVLGHSEVAAELRHRLGMDVATLRYSSSEQRIEQCRRHYEEAVALVEDTRQVDPDDVWRTLMNTDHHDLMALVITLAALVPTDQPELGRWVKDLPVAGPSQRSVARGLAMLIPVRPRLRALPAGGTARCRRPGLCVRQGLARAETAVGGGTAGARPRRGDDGRRRQRRTGA
jgi:hypothetical protein